MPTLVCACEHGGSSFLVFECGWSMFVASQVGRINVATRTW